MAEFRDMSRRFEQQREDDEIEALGFDTRGGDGTAARNDDDLGHWDDVDACGRRAGQ